MRPISIDVWHCLDACAFSFSILSQDTGAIFTDMDLCQVGEIDAIDIADLCAMTHQPDKKILSGLLSTMISDSSLWLSASYAFTKSSTPVCVGEERRYAC